LKRRCVIGLLFNNRRLLLCCVLSGDWWIYRPIISMHAY